MSEDVNVERVEEPEENIDDVSVGTMVYSFKKLKSKPDLIIRGEGFTIRLTEDENRRVDAVITTSLRPPVTVPCR